MSTNIKIIKGTYHVHSEKNSFKVEHKEAELDLTRFFNGKVRGTAIQLTISNPKFGTSYIHLNKRQCKELAKTLLDCFDYDKYPPI